MYHGSRSSLLLVCSTTSGFAACVIYPLLTGSLWNNQRAIHEEPT